MLDGKRLPSIGMADAGFVRSYSGRCCSWRRSRCGNDAPSPPTTEPRLDVLEAGRLLLARDGDLWTLDLPGGRLHQLTSTPGVVEHPGSWSPDGHRVVYSTTQAASPGQPTSGSPEVWTMNVDGTGQLRVSGADGGELPSSAA